jgi:hydroxymethylpyrimidine/phosphomethylpyrimidine kinase
MRGRVLSIAGSDSGGGAGIQADIKAITMLGGYAATAITALTAQNTMGVFGILEVPTDFLKQQINLVLSDIGADAIKTGMLHSVEVINAVSECLNNYAEIPLIVDPVMVSTSGNALLKTDAVTALKDRLISRATLVTPNIPEAEILSSIKINNLGDMEKAAGIILKTGVKAVLLKGGHGTDEIVQNLLLTASGEKEIFESPRIHTKNTHGTGCTLASAIACKLSQNETLVTSVGESIEYVYQAIKTSDGFGMGNGPIKHNFWQNS